MDSELQKKIAQAIQDPRNLGELSDADAVGTVGNSECGEMLRLWLKFRQENGRKVIDQATFQSFGCETAIAVASLATELIKGKTAEEVLSLKSGDLAPDLGPLPPMKIHCAELVQGALKSALDPASQTKKSEGPASAPAAESTPAGAPTLLDSFSTPQKGRKIVFLEPGE